MSDPSVRLEELPARRMARFRAVGPAPEREAWEQLRCWAEPRGLLRAPDLYPIFGFNSPGPSPGRPDYGYEFWIAVGPADEGGGDVVDFDFPGGWYAATRIRGLPSPETWRRLVEWVRLSPVRPRLTHELERPLNPLAAESDLEFELYLPVEARAESGAGDPFAPSVASVIPTVRAFIAAINAHDMDALGALMTEDHTFIDSAGTSAAGREAMLHGWRGYLAQFPDFTIHPDSMLQDGAVVAVFGSWSATYGGKEGLRPENAVASPAAWRAVVEGGRLKSWRIFTDHTRTIEVMRREAERTVVRDP